MKVFLSVFICLWIGFLQGEVTNDIPWQVRIQEAVQLLNDTTECRVLAKSPSLEKHISPWWATVNVEGLDYLWISVNDGGDGFGGDHTCWVKPQLVRNDGVVVDATTLPVRFHYQGWEKLYLVRPKGRHSKLIVAGTVYTNGWWFHPKGTLCLKLDKKYKTFSGGGATDFSAHAGGKVGYSIESHLDKIWLKEIFADNFAKDYPQIDRWLKFDITGEEHKKQTGHELLFNLPKDQFQKKVEQLLQPNALSRLAVRDALAFAWKTLDLVNGRGRLSELEAQLKGLESEYQNLPITADWTEFLKRVRALRRKIIFSHSSLDFEDLIINQQPTPLYHHQCDQYLGRHAVSGPGLCVLKNWKTDKPEKVALLEGKLPIGSVAHPDLSFDAKRILFPFCDTSVADSRFRRYFIWQINVDGSELKQLTGTANDALWGEGGRETALIEDFDPCYLPDGDIVFVSTRCQSFGRCHAGRYNPSYLLYRMNGDGTNIRALSFGEANEWDPSVLADGRLIYTRWDYINRHDTLYQSLWTMHPDGTQTTHYYGNYTINPCMIAEARSIPNSTKVVATATAHHSYTHGSIIVLDTQKGEDGLEPVKRITPEVAFPETEYSTQPGAYQTPWPLSEDLFLVAYTPEGNKKWGEASRFSICLIDSLGGREEIYTDPTCSTISPIPLKPRFKPPLLASHLPKPENQNVQKNGELFIQNINVMRWNLGEGVIKRLRVNEIIGQPTAHVPHRGAVYQEIVKRVLGTAEVAADGSVACVVPSGKPLQLQALDGDGKAVITMRSFIYVQAGEKLGCVGCHENRQQAPQDLANARNLNNIKVQTLKPLKSQNYDGGFNYVRSVQPVLNRHCVKCHGGEKTKDSVTGTKQATVDLRGDLMVRPAMEYPFNPTTIRVPISYNTLLDRPGWVALAQRNQESTSSRPYDYFAAAGKLASHLLKGHSASLLASPDDLETIITWLDLNAQCYGDYSWQHYEEELTPPLPNGKCGLKPCRCGSCWVKQK